MGLDFQESAVPTISLENCARCGDCAAICPTGTLTMDDDRVRVESRTFMGCIGCGQCMMTCSTGAITVSGRRFAPQDVVDLPPPAQRATADQFDGLLLARRSVRQFKEKEVDRELVERIVEIVSTAPMGVPPQEVGITIIHGRRKVRRFAEEMVAMFERTVPVFNPLILRVMRPFMAKAERAMIRDFVRPTMALLAERWKEGQDAFCYGAPAAMIFHGTPLSDPADTHIAITYAMLAAESLGLGNCWIGTAIALDHYKQLKSKYGIPKDNKIGGMLVIGHPAVEYGRSVRRKLASVEWV